MATVAIQTAANAATFHGPFSFVMLLGIIWGTYSSIAIATPLLYQPKLLNSIVSIMVALCVIGAVIAMTDNEVIRMVLGGLIVVGCAAMLVRIHRGGPGYLPAGKPVGA